MSRCFIYGKKRHYAKQCKSKKRIPTKLLQMIQKVDFDDDYYGWTTNPAKIVLALEKESEIEESSSSGSNNTEEEPIMMMKPPLLLDLNSSLRPTSGHT